jgi:hypothetical protein
LDATETTKQTKHQQHHLDLIRLAILLTVTALVSVAVAVILTAAAILQETTNKQ